MALFTLESFINNVIYKEQPQDMSQNAETTGCNIPYIGKFLRQKILKNEIESLSQMNSQMNFKR